MEAKVFAAILHSELERRQNRNGKYSLRAFARDLEVEASALSKWVRKIRVPQPQTRNLLLEKIGFFAAEADSKKNFGCSVMKTIDLSSFQTIADWSYFAVLELTATRGFIPNKLYVAKRLGLSLKQAQKVCTQLFEFGFLLKKPDGSWCDTLQQISTLSIGATHFALRKLQSDLLAKAIDALEHIDPSLRDQSSITMAIDPNRLPEAKQKILEFRRSLMEFLEASEDRTEVYSLLISLFPLSTQANYLLRKGKKTEPF